MQSQTNLAYDEYDLARFEAPVKAAEKPVIKVRKASSAASAATGVKFVGLVLAAGMLLCCGLYGKVEASKLQSEITAKTKEVDLLYSENVRMRSELEGRASLKNVEEYVKNVLGLQKLDASQKEYVALQTANVVEMSETSDNIFVIIKNKFNQLVEYLRG